MKKALLFLLIPLFSYGGIHEDFEFGPLKADEITYDWLVKGAVLEGHETAHVAVFKKIFESTKIKNLLEFGLGYSTKYFLDQCNKVISIDIITHGYGSGIMKKFIGVFRDYANWVPFAFFSGYVGCDYSWAPYKHLGSDALYKATSYQHAHQKHFAKLDDFYLTELNAFLSNILKYNKTDIVFVGHAIFLRADFVQLLFNKIPIIVAHNTDPASVTATKDIYGYSHLVKPENYEEIFLPVTDGTTVWIEKKPETQKLIETLKTFAEELKLQ